VSSRREQKERLRREREQREQAAKAAQRRKRLVGYGVGGAIALAAVGAIIAVIATSGGGGDGPGGSAPAAGDLPSGGSVPVQKVGDLRQAAQAAGCVTKDYPGTSREHLQPGAPAPRYTSEPPTSGSHDPTPAEDGAYNKAPAEKNLVHTMEHGRVIIWFKPSLPKEQIANLKALFDEDQYQMLLVPNTKMTAQVAATAWDKDPQPNGTGRLLECPRYNDRIFDALKAFRDEHRGNGPEPVP
jgi:uncharacterized protein DUF3105